MATEPKIDKNDPASSSGRALLLQHLQEAHATEQALVTNLRAHIAMTPRGSYRSSLERHLTETQEHERAVARRIREIGRGRGLLGAAYGVLTTAVGQALVLTKGPLDLLRGGPGGEEKLLKNARDEVVTEALEIAIYDALEALARAIGDEPTARLAARHRGEEERMLARAARAHPAPRQAPSRRRAPAAGRATTGDDGRGRHRAASRAARAAQATHPPPARQEDGAADRRLREADRQRGRGEAHGLHAGAAGADDRLRARAPQARDGDRARAEPAGGRAVPRLRRADRARRRAAAARRRRGDRAPRCASTRGATSAASRCSRPPSASSAGRRHDRRRARDPRQPQDPDRPDRPGRADPARRPRAGARVPDTPDGPRPPEPDDPLPARPRRARRSRRRTRV